VKVDLPAFSVVGAATFHSDRLTAGRPAADADDATEADGAGDADAAGGVGDGCGLGRIAVDATALDEVDGEATPPHAARERTTNIETRVTASRVTDGSPSGSLRPRNLSSRQPLGDLPRW
jgi:hypothetical protein